MQHFMEKFISDRPLGLKIIVIGLAIGAAGVSPLLLYILLGPSNGNPIGLGLLMVLAVFLAILFIAVGLITLAVQMIRQ